MAIQLSKYINITEIRDRVKTQIEYYSTRPDVPTLEELNLRPDEISKVDDLLGANPTFTLTHDGKHAVSEFVLQDDMFRGVKLPSPSVPLLFCLLPLLGALTVLFYNFTWAPLHAVFVLPLLISLLVVSSIGVSMASWKDIAVAWFTAYAGPAYLSHMIGSETFSSHAWSIPIPFLDFSVSWAVGLCIGGLLLACVCSLFCLLVVPRGYKLETCQNASQIVLSLTGMALVGGLLQDVANGMGHFGFPLSLLAVSLPFIGGCMLGPARYARQIMRGRPNLLAIQSSQFSSADGLTASNATAKKAEKTQTIKMAARDNSPVFVPGPSNGHLLARGSDRALAEGRPCRISLDSLSRHIACLGETGGGKSASLAIPLISFWIESGWGGAFIMDGKEELPLLFKGVRNFTLIDSSVSIAPFQNMEKDAIVQALLDVAGVNVSEQSTGNGQHFKVNGYLALDTAVALMFAMCEAERANHAHAAIFSNDPVPARVWTITPDSLLRIADELKNWDDNNYSRVLEYVLFIKKWSPDILRTKEVLPDGTATTALSYPTPEGRSLQLVFSHITNIQATPHEERASIAGTMQTWVLGMFKNKKLLHWCSRETGGFMIEKLLYGASAGFHLPKEEFGDTGLVFQALTKQRLMTAAKKRTKGWEARHPNQKPMLLAMDEYHSKGIWSQGDEEFISKCRSWKITVFILSQALESLYKAMGEPATDAFLQNIKTKVFFRNADAHATTQYAMKTFGKIRTSPWGIPKRDINLLKGAQLASQMAIFDPEHPNHASYERLQRKGLGGFQDAAHVTRQGLTGHHDSQHDDSDIMALIASSVPLVTGRQESREEYLVDELMYASETGAKGMALIQCQRGGNVMQATVKTDFIERPPASLFGPDTIPDSVMDELDETDDELMQEAT